MQFLQRQYRTLPCHGPYSGHHGTQGYELNTKHSSLLLAARPGDISRPCSSNVNRHSFRVSTGYHSLSSPTVPRRHGHLQQSPVQLNANSPDGFSSCDDPLRELVDTCDTHHCHQPCVVRLNKALPPPTLSPILPPSISNPASLSPPSPSSLNKLAENADPESDMSSLSHAWPTMDKFFFPDHCCRTSVCHSSKPKGDQKSSGRRASYPFVSELPPPLPSKHCSEQGGCRTLSASIWGTGWHQVEPLPASFIKTLQSNPKLLGHECEQSSFSLPHHPHARLHQRQNHKQAHPQHSQQRPRRDSGHGQGHGQSSHRTCKAHQHHNQQQQHGQRSNGGRCKPIAADKSSSASSSWSTICSSRLPRSLQFID